MFAAIPFKTVSQNVLSKRFTWNSVPKQPNMEERWIAQNKELTNALSTQQLATFNDSMEKQLHFVDNPIPKFHTQFESLRGYPKGLDSSNGYNMLWSAYEHGRTSHIKNECGAVEIMSDDVFSRRPDYLLSRLQWFDETRIKWYETASLGDIDTRYYDIISQQTYDHALFHSFSNCIGPIMPVESGIHGGTYILIGLTDLSVIARSNMCFQKKSEMVFVNMSHYTIAKTTVIYEMLKDKDIGCESVLEVWYSSTWTKRTRTDFKKVVAKLSTTLLDTEVKSIVKHWNKSKGVSLEIARNSWMDSITRTNSEIACFKQMQDIMDYAEYRLTGDVIAPDDDHEGIECGSITMFNNIEECGSRAKDENIYNVIDIPNNREWLSLRKHKSMKIATLTTLLADITALKDLIVSNRIEMEFIMGTVSLENRHLIEKLKALDPQNIIWSNCIDYMHPKAFHKIAKEIGNKDCFHYGNSMNWVLSFKGSHIIDYSSVKRTQLLAKSKEFIKSHWKGDMSEIFLFPPIDNPVNYGSVYTTLGSWSKWAKWFFSQSISGTDIKIDRDNIDQSTLVYNPLKRSNTIFNFGWTYGDLRPNLQHIK